MVKRGRISLLLIAILVFSVLIYRTWSYRGYASAMHILPREGFNLFFETGRGEKVDTYTGMVTKDLVWDPDTSIRLVLSDEEMDRIYRKAIDLGVFEMPQPHPPYAGHGGREPSTWMRLRFSAGPASRDFTWDTHELVSPLPRDWKRLMQFVRFVMDTVAARPEYKALPSARGAYQ